jgi:hypothetical protein
MLERVTSMLFMALARALGDFIRFVVGKKLLQMQTKRLAHSQDAFGVHCKWQ